MNDGGLCPACFWYVPPGPSAGAGRSLPSAAIGVLSGAFERSEWAEMHSTPAPGPPRAVVAPILEVLEALVGDDDTYVRGKRMTMIRLEPRGRTSPRSGPGKSDSLAEDSFHLQVEPPLPPRGASE